MQAPTSRIGRALYFFNLLGDTAPVCLDWTKVGVALSTTYTALTGAVATVQQVIGTAAHTDWALFASAIGLHAASHTALRVKRHLDAQP